jgi:hypothetical protein
MDEVLLQALQESKQSSDNLLAAMNNLTGSVQRLQGIISPQSSSNVVPTTILYNCGSNQYSSSSSSMPPPTDQASENPHLLFDEEVFYFFSTIYLICSIRIS